MANRKMIQPQARPLRNPPPPRLTAVLEVKHDIEVLDVSCDIMLDGVLLEFSSETRFIAMTARAARQLAATLLARAQQLEDQQEPQVAQPQQGAPANV